MGLLDANDETSDDAVEFDEDSKIHLFETHQKTKKGIHDYARTFLPVVLAAIILVVVFGFLMTPRAGDEIRASDELYNAVYEHMLTKEKRSISEVKFYKCDEFYWVKLLAEPKPFPASNPEDPVNQFRLSAQQVDGRWQVSTLQLQKPESDMPCVR